MVLAMASLAEAQDTSVYKWVDPQGVPHYSDQPPTDASAEELNIRVRRTDKTVAQNRPKPKSEAGETAPAPAANEADQSAEDADRQKVLAERAATCEKARDRVAKYGNARRLYKPGPDGERIYLTDEEIDAERADAERAVTEWCDDQ
jgi:hypothetical protein